MPKNVIAAPELILWIISALLLIVAVLLYLIDPVIQHFERIPPLLVLRDVLAPYRGSIPAIVHHHFSDFAWAFTAAVFANHLLNTARRGTRMGILLMAATSWEWLQGAGIAPGVFDSRDVLVSSLAAILVGGVHALCIERNIEPAVESS